jgi:hypothetical protein
MKIDAHLKEVALPEGMTKREYVATQLLAGFLANPSKNDYTLKELVEDAIMLADILLKKLGDK